VREIKILIDLQPSQVFFVFDHFGLVINKFSSKMMLFQGVDLAVRHGAAAEAPRGLHLGSQAVDRDRFLGCERAAHRCVEVHRW